MRVRRYFSKPVTINSRSCYVKLLLYFTEWRTEIILPTTRTTKNKLPSPKKTLIFFLRSRCSFVYFYALFKNIYEGSCSDSSDRNSYQPSVVFDTETRHL